MEPLADDQLNLLNGIVAAYFASPLSSPLRGHAIRATMSGSLAERRALLESLAPGHLRQQGEPLDHDTYAVTPAGLLASDAAPVARAVLAAIHVTLKKRVREPDFDAFSFAELAVPDDCPVTQATVDKLICIFGFSSNALPFDKTMAWKRPAQVEDLTELATVEEFVGALRSRWAAANAPRAKGVGEQPSRRVIALQASPREIAAPDLTWMRDPALRRIATDDFRDMNVCLRFGANKAAMLLAGSACESMLLDMLERNSHIAKTHLTKPHDFPDRVSLEQLVQVAVAERLLTDTSSHFAPALKNYRDLIHPHRVRRSNISVDSQTAWLVADAAALIGRDLVEADATGRAAAFEENK